MLSYEQCAQPLRVGEHTLSSVAREAAGALCSYAHSPLRRLVGRAILLPSIARKDERARVCELHYTRALEPNATMCAPYATSPREGSVSDVTNSICY